MSLYRSSRTQVVVQFVDHTVAICVAVGGSIHRVGERIHNVRPVNSMRDDGTPYWILVEDDEDGEE